MLSLYLGFLLGQSLSALEVIISSNIPPLMIFFSVVVLVIWSFFPIMGYGLGRILNFYCLTPKTQSLLRHSSSKVLFAVGLIMSLIERSLYNFKILTDIDGYLGDGYYGLLISAIAFFLIAFLPLDKLSSQNKSPV